MADQVASETAGPIVLDLGYKRLLPPTDLNERYYSAILAAVSARFALDALPGLQNRHR